LAVFAVIFYHAGFPGFAGGYLGVDIFFVISGYLISSILIKSLKNDSFSFFNFYERRARRILPALLSAVLFCIPIAYIFFGPAGFKDFFQSVAATIFSVSNILFWWEAGYFDNSSDLKLLIHTWSLGVEEQFYIFFPIFLFFFWKKKKEWLPIAIIFVFFASLSIAEFSSLSYPTTSFYFLHTRAWELFVGIYLSYRENFNPIKLNNFKVVILKFIGLFALIMSFIFFDTSYRHPGLFTLFPVLGVGFLILKSQDHDLVTKFLSKKVFVKIGLISYSLYLFHQPIFVLLRLTHINNPSNIAYLIGILASLAIAQLSYRFIETPFRNKNKIKTKTFFYLVSIVSLILVSLSLIIESKNGFKERFNDSYYSIFDVEGGVEPTIDGKRCHGIGLESECIIGSLNKNPNWALIGDSHASTLSRSFDIFLKQIDESAIQMTVGGCAYALDLTKKGIDCFGINNKIRSTLIAKDIDNVVIAGRYVRNYEETGFDNEVGGIESDDEDESFIPITSFDNELEKKSLILNSYKKTIVDLLNLEKTVFLIYPIPEVGYKVPDYRLKLKIRGINKTLTTSSSVYYKRSNSVINIFDSINDHPKLFRIYPGKIFCNSFEEGKCITEIDSKLLYFDDDHLSNYGASIIIEELKI